MSRADNEKIGGLKQSDIAMLVLIVAISLIASYLVGDALINTSANREVEVQVISPISDQFTTPSADIFVDDFINPTELIEIGNSNNNQPFGNQQN
jgi:hypothetical protein